MKPVQNRTARDIQDRLGSEFTVLEFETLTRSANEAALAIGCTVDHIAKSLVFCTDDGEPVLVIVSGASRVDERKVSAQLGKAIHRADAQFVRDKTGFSIGGVPPLGHRTPPAVMIDVALQNVSPIWAAAGTPNAVFALEFAQLVSLTRASVLEVSL
jgi:prolyl-tRNA editing enzyme YbaK/EbsC (Cys-tRNA(Pro) deacylase)